MPYTILAATTGADQSVSVKVSSRYKTRPCVFRCPGLAGAETGVLQLQNADGSWSNALDSSGATLTLSTTVQNLPIYAPGVYRVDKSVTAAAVPVEISTDENP